MMHQKNLKQAIKKVEMPAEKKRELERKPLLDYAKSEKLNLIPLVRETKTPLCKWMQYQQEAYPKENWQRDFIKDGHNIAVVCGVSSDNLIIVDCDKPKLAQKIFGKDIRERTFVVETGGDPKGRMQVYFKADYSPNGRKYHDIHVEILGQGNYAVYPPSIHPTSGRKYKPLQMTAIARIEGDPIQELHELLRDAFGNKFKPEKKIHNIDDLIRGVEHGNRDNATVKIVNWLRQGEVTEEKALAYLLEWNQKNYMIKDGKKTADPLDISVIEDKTRRCYSRAEAYGYKFNRSYTPETTYSKDVKEKAKKILGTGDPFKFINQAVKLIHAGDEQMIQVEWISALSSHVTRKIKINTWQIGKSQKGKSHSLYTTLHLLPKECYEIFTSSSPLAFFYYIKKFGEWSLDKKLIFVDEVEASKNALPILRALTGQTDIIPRHLTVHEAEILDLQIKGRRAVWFTSVKTFGSEQIKNRFIHLNPDETQKQDSRVFHLQTDEYWNEMQLDNEPLMIAQAMSQMIIKDTTEYRVKKPSKPVWPFKSRRWLFPIFVMFVNVITKIRYKQREIKDGMIIAQKEDIDKAKELWKKFQETIIYRVSAIARTIYDMLPEDKDDAMTNVEIAENVTIGTQQVRKYCMELLEEGIVSRRKRTGRGGAWEYWKAKLIGFDTVEVDIDKRYPITLYSKKNKKSKSTFRSETDKKLYSVRKAGKGKKKKETAKEAQNEENDAFTVSEFTYEKKD